MRHGLILIAVLVAAPAAAQTAESGRRIADRWCAECHAVSGTQARAVDGVPSFEAIARDPRIDEPTFLDRVTAPRHPAMPGFALSREDMRGLWTFLRAQRP